jgi:YHS domain-containing protein
LAALVLWMIRRVLAAFQSPKPTGSRKDAPKPETVMVKDPVCGMYMDARLAIRLEKTSEAVYFCSEECKNKYIEPV